MNNRLLKRVLGDPQAKTIKRLRKKVQEVNKLEDKYKKLAAHFKEKGFDVDSVIYHDSIAGKLAKELTRYRAILVWVNPLEKRHDRKILDALLDELAGKGCFISAHPDTILKIGTKEILY